MRQSPLKRKTPLHAKSTMKHRRSAKARAKEFSPSVRHIVMERSNGLCEICKMRPLEEIHHATYRSQGGTGGLSNACGVCRHCHELCHSTRAMREYAVELAQQLAHEQQEIGTTYQVR